MATVEAMAIAVLRAAGEPLSADQILSRISERQGPEASPPKKATVASALSYNPRCERVGRDLYMYFAHAYAGASFHLPLLGADPQRRRLPIGMEVIAALGSAWTGTEQAIDATLLLADGPSLRVRIPLLPDLGAWLMLPAGFWRWLRGVRERGADWWNSCVALCRSRWRNKRRRRGPRKM